jgi:hypothetical protein
MDRRNFLSIMLAGGSAIAMPAWSSTQRLTNARELDVEVRPAGGGGALHLPVLLQRRCMLLVIEGNSLAAAAWLKAELGRLSPEQFEDLIVLLVDPVPVDPSQPPLLDAAGFPGLRLYRTTVALWRRPVLGAVMPQLLGFADDGRLKARAVGAGPGQPGLAQFHTELRK